MPRGKSIDFDFDYKAFKAEIKKRKLSYRELAEKLGVTESGLSHIISADRKPSFTLYKLICNTLGLPEGALTIKPEPPKTEQAEELVYDKQIDRIETQLDRMERKLDRLEMIVRSIQNENLVLRQELLKRK